MARRRREAEEEVAHEIMAMVEVVQMRQEHLVLVSADWEEEVEVV